MKEIWKNIPGYEGAFQASNLGRIRSIDRYVKRVGGGFINKGTVLKPYISKDGYHRISLSVNGKRKTKTVHRLIALSFISNMKNKEMVNHKDGDRGNNNINNLEWVTRSENEKHKYEVLGQIPTLRKKPLRCWKGKFGGYHNTSKKINQLSENGDIIKTWSSLIEASRHLGLKGTTGITKVLKGKRERSGGYGWEYA